MQVIASPSLDLVGDRWTLVVIRDLLFGNTRFGEFLLSDEHIPTNILAEYWKRPDITAETRKTAGCIPARARDSTSLAR